MSEIEKLITTAYDNIRSSGDTADSAVTAAAIALGRLCYEFDLSPGLICDFIQMSYNESKNGEVN